MAHPFEDGRTRRKVDTSPSRANRAKREGD